MFVIVVVVQLQRLLLNNRVVKYKTTAQVIVVQFLGLKLCAEDFLSPIIVGLEYFVSW